MATTPPPSSPALLPEGEGGLLPLPSGEGWGEGEFPFTKALRMILTLRTMNLGSENQPKGTGNFIRQLPVHWGSPRIY